MFMACFRVTVLERWRSTYRLLLREVERSKIKCPNQSEIAHARMTIIKSSMTEPRGTLLLNSEIGCAALRRGSIPGSAANLRPW
jgi:hypothetical protein